MEPADVFLTRLLNSDVQVIGQPMRGVQSAAIGILVGTGARDEQPSQYGVSHFTEQLLFRGTEHLDTRQLSERFDALGISHDSSAGIEMTLVSAVMLGDHVPAALDLLADVVRFPAFPLDAMEQVRMLLLQELLQREDQPAQRVFDAVRQQFFAGSPVGNDVLGTDETIRTMARDGVVRYWEDRYTANNMVISIAGNFNWDEAIDQLERLTATWPQGRGRMVMKEPTPQSGFRVMQRETAQENIGFAFPAVAVSDSHYYVAALLSQALGGGSNSRLFQEVREKRGLAYAVQSRFDGLEKTGLIRIYVGTSVERAHESVEVILDELRKLEQTGITEDELRLAKTRLKSQFVMRSESTSARMVANLRSWWFEQKLYSLQEVRDRIDQVTVEQVLGLGQQLGIVHNLTGVALGPRSEEELFGSLLAQL
jgi:predicted Zn-dependent peptidase